MTGNDIYSASQFLIVAAIVAVLARRFNLPYTVGLVAAGLGLAVAHVSPKLTLTGDLIFDVLLPPLLFEAALNIRWQELKRDALPVTVLVTLGVLISAAAVALGLAYFCGWPLRSAAVFGVLIAATDPVSVIAMFKEIGVGGRLRLLVEAESLLNDGVAAVLFSVALTVAEGSGTVTAGEAISSLGVSIGGGVLVGALAAGLALLISRRTNDHLVETALTAAVAYGAFLQAEHLHVSGVIATVVAGLVMGNIGALRDDDKLLSVKGRETVLTVWDFAAFISNTLIFMLIGTRVAAVPFRALGVESIVGSIALVLIGRFLAVYPLSSLFSKSRLAIESRFQHVMFWGGLRGALALALALSVPVSIAYRNEIVVATFSVVAFSVIIQGVSMPALIRRLGLARATD